MTLKLIHSEARMEVYRQAEMETIYQRIERKRAELASLKAKREEINRAILQKTYSIDDDLYRLRLLETKKATPEIPPIEPAIYE